MGKHRAWTKEEIALLGTMPDADLAMKLSESKANIAYQRSKRGIQPFNKNKSNILQAWSEKELALLGSMSDAAVAHVTGRNLNSVQAMRNRRRIAPFNRRTSKQDLEFLTWSKALAMDAPTFYAAISAQHESCFNIKMTHRLLSNLSHYSLSRMQKWFTPGSAQEPLAITTRHHLWLLAKSWGEK